VNRTRLNQLYTSLVIAAGLAVVALCGYKLPVKQLNVRFLLLALVTVAIGSRVSVQIPRVKAHISVSDTFIFLTLLLFGGEAAVLVATAEALCSSLRIGKRIETHFFNSSVMAVSTFLSFISLRLLFGQFTIEHQSYSADFVIALCVMALVQYVTNSVLVATSSAMNASQPIWLTWRQNFLWSSMTYFAGASAAGIIAKMIGDAGFFAFIATIPIIGIVYLTYWTYMKKVEAAAAQAEQARRHVEELNRHIAEQQRMSKALQETQEHFRNAFDHAAIGMALVSTQGSWLRVNRSMCEILGYSEKELLRSNFQSITHEDDVRNDLANLYRLLQGETLTCQVEKRYLHKLGQTVWALNSVSLVRDSQDNPGHFIFQIQDISERKRAEAALHSLSLIDELTSLYNRRGFLAVAEQHLATILRSNQVPVILYCDLDGLKDINDSLGHLEGDRALVKTAEIFKQTFRNSDIVARLGGDEFVVLATLAPEESADSLISRLQEKLATTNSLRTSTYDLSVSVGVAHLNAGETRSIEELMVRADKAMYANKRRKRSREVLTPEFGKTRIEAVA
jgi:diguanylate cyclase (GGDEF)-like protein/PAS domain S-box-containing protein